MKNNQFIVDESGIRLDKYLADKIDHLSRSQIQKYIKNGFVSVNDVIQVARYVVNVGDQISVTFTETKPESEQIIPENIPLDIIFEDDELIVINKVAGMTVHPGINNTNGTLANALAFHCNALSDINGQIRPGIVHRLDQYTSGVIIAAKSNTAHMRLAEQFAKRQVKKVYVGITWGNWKDNEGVINQAIDRSKNDHTSFIVHDNGKESQTKYKILSNSRYFSVVNFYPKTGRTHQIRVHSDFMGHPIIGDDKYGGGHSRGKGFIPEITKKIHLLFKLVNRHMLHAQNITFIHPKNGKELTFIAIIPEDMENIISKIELLDV